MERPAPAAPLDPAALHVRVHPAPGAHRVRQHRVRVGLRVRLLHAPEVPLVQVVRLDPVEPDGRLRHVAKAPRVVPHVREVLAPVSRSTAIARLVRVPVGRVVMVMRRVVVGRVVTVMVRVSAVIASLMVSVLSVSRMVIAVSVRLVRLVRVMVGRVVMVMRRVVVGRFATVVDRVVTVVDRVVMVAVRAIVVIVRHGQGSSGKRLLNGL